jgi:hypothetical protein
VQVFKLGFLATATHLVEILPLVALLLGLKPFVQQRPSYWISIVICVTTPITMFIYAQCARAWDRVTAMDQIRQSTDIIDLVSDLAARARNFVGSTFQAKSGKIELLRDASRSDLCRDGSVYLERSVRMGMILKVLGVALVLAVTSVLLPFKLPLCDNVYN